MSLVLNLGKLDTDTAYRMKQLGFIEMTEDAKEALDGSPVELLELFAHYVNGDYGDVPDAGKNDVALYTQQGECSARYPLPSGEVLIIETVFGKPVTTIKVEVPE